MLAAEEAIAESGIGSKGRFPGPLYLAPPPLEIEWRDRIEMAEMAASNADTDYPDLMRVANDFAAKHGAFKFGIIGEHLAERFGTVGSPVSLNTACASGASAIQLGMEAIRRGDCDAALAIGADASLTPESLVRFSLLSALSTQNDPPELASKPFSKNRDGFVLAEGAAALVLENLDHARARGARVLGILEGVGEKSELVPPHPLKPRRQADHRLRAQRARRCGCRPGTRRLHQRPRHFDAGKRQDGASRRFDRVRRTHSQHSDFVQQIDDRAYADRRRSRRSGVHLPDAAKSTAAADHQSSNSRSGDHARRRAECRRAMRKSIAPFPIRLASADRMSASLWRWSRRESRCRHRRGRPTQRPCPSRWKVHARTHAGRRSQARASRRRCAAAAGTGRSADRDQGDRP